MSKVLSLHPTRVSLFTLMFACSSSPVVTDASSPDATSQIQLDASPEDAAPVDAAAAPDAAPEPDSGEPDAGVVVPFALTSTAFAEGGVVPLRHECGPPLQGPGQNISPALTWTPGPVDTQSYAIVIRDIDARIPQYPRGIIHWVIYDIPADVLALPEGIRATHNVANPAGARQANIQGSGFFGYFGPCSDNRVNTYVWTLHAMPTATLPGVSMRSTESEVAAQIESTSIAQATLSGES